MGASTTPGGKRSLRPQHRASTRRPCAKPPLARWIPALGSKHDGFRILRVSQRLKVSIKAEWSLRYSCQSAVNFAVEHSKPSSAEAIARTLRFRYGPKE